MHEEKYTRCPGCKTIFRVTLAQLAIRAGQVRCGHCKTVFDGNEQLISLAPPSRDDGDDGYDESTLGPPTVTLRSAHALEAPAGDDAPPATAAGAGSQAFDEIAYEERFAWDKQKKKPRRAAGAAYALAMPVLVLFLAGQALFHFRDAVAARWPVAKPAMSAPIASSAPTATSKRWTTSARPRWAWVTCSSSKLRAAAAMARLEPGGFLVVGAGIAVRGWPAATASDNAGR